MGFHWKGGEGGGGRNIGEEGKDERTGGVLLCSCSSEGHCVTNYVWRFFDSHL